MPLDWFVRPAMVLDLREAGTGTVGVEYLEREFARVGRRPRPLDVVPLHTGADRHLGKPEYFTEFTGLGVRVVGTDAFSLDRVHRQLPAGEDRRGRAGHGWWS